MRRGACIKGACIKGAYVIGSLTLIHLLGAGCGHRISDAERRQAQNRARLATSMLTEGELAAALREARRSVELDPDCVDCRLTLATVYGARGEMEQAEQAYLEVLRRDPDNPYAQNGLAVVYLNLGRPAEAIRYARQASENEDYVGRHLAFYNLGWAHLEEGNYPAALEALTAALREAPGMCLAHFRIAEVFFRQRSYEEALSHLDQALEVPEPSYESPTHEQPQHRTCDQMADTHHLRGLVLLALGREEEARESFGRCLEIATARSEIGRRCANQMNSQD